MSPGGAPHPDHGPDDHGPDGHGPDDHGPDDHGPDDHGHDHGHGHGGRFLTRARRLLSHHSHDPGRSIDRALESSERGIRALRLSLVALAATALGQAVVAVASSSVALLADTLHNVADALTALPLWLAFALGRRPANRRYPYGYGRAEDVAGVVVVLVVAASAAFALFEALRAVADPRPVRHLPAVAVASVLGFAGNELVARYRMRVGRAIGSAALVADGLHARADGFTSLGVLAGAVGVALGWPAADAVAGLAISLAIAAVLRTAGRDVLARLMDSVRPELVDQAEAVLAGVPGVERVGRLRIRWIGHRLHAEAEVDLDAGLSLVEAHHIAEDARHALLHRVPRLASAIVHPDPCGHDGRDHHAALAHHGGEGRAPSGTPEAAPGRGDRGDGRPG